MAALVIGAGLTRLLPSRPAQATHASDITFVAAATNVSSTQITSFTIDKPAGAVQNDLLIAQISVAGGTGTAITAPAGWTLVIRTDSTTVVGQAIYYLVAGASEPASYTWTLSPAARFSGGINAYRGVNTTTPINAFGGQANASSTSILAPSITTTFSTLVVGFFGIDGATTITPPAGMTERFDVTGGSASSPTSEAADVAQAVMGATGAKTATAAAAAVNIGQLVALAKATTNFTGVALAYTAQSGSPSRTRLTLSFTAVDSATIARKLLFNVPANTVLAANATFSVAPNGGAGFTQAGGTVALSGTTITITANADFTLNSGAPSTITLDGLIVRTAGTWGATGSNTPLQLTSRTSADVPLDSTTNAGSNITIDAAAAGATAQVKATANNPVNFINAASAGAVTVAVSQTAAFAAGDTAFAALFVSGGAASAGSVSGGTGASQDVTGIVTNGSGGGPTLADGAIVVYTFKQPSGGNFTAAATGTAATKDVGVPAQPAAPDLDAGSDSGASSTDNITNDNTPSLSGTAEANSSVQVLDGTTSLGTTTANGGGAWAFTTAALTDGVHSLTVKATDAAGNVSVASAALSVTIDTVAPVAAPSTPDLDVASDTGTSGTDNLINDTTPTFTGTAEASITVEVFRAGSTSLGTTTAGGGGTWTFTSGALADGTHSITATAKDTAGNVSPVSGALSITIETVVPTFTVLTAPGDNSTLDVTFSEGVYTATSGGALIAADFTVSGGLTVTGVTHTAGQSTATLALSGAATPGVTTLAAVASGIFDNAANAAGTGAQTVRAGFTNVSLTYVPSSGSVSATRLTITFTAETNSAVVRKISFRVPTGTVLAANATFTVTPNGGTAFTQAGGTVALSGTTVTITANSDFTMNGGGASSLVLDGLIITTAGTWGRGSSNTPLNLTSKTSADASIDGPSMALANVTIDAAAAGATAQVKATANNLVNFINTTSAGAVTVAASQTAAFAAGDKAFGVLVGSAGNASGKFVSGGTGTSQDVTGIVTNGSGGGPTINDGAITVYTFKEISGGNITAAVAGTAATRDTVAPTAPSTPDLDAASDAGSSSTDNITNDNTPTFTGTGEANSTIELFRAGTTSLGTTTANGAGAWTFTSGTLVDGVHSITAKARDAAGNLSGALAGLSITIDTVAPAAAPSTPDLDVASDTGTSSTDNLTNDTTPTFTGTAEANITVEVFRAGTTSLGTTTANGAGAWTFTSGVVADGTHSITAKAIDTAGNVSAASAALSITIETVVPTFTVTTAPGSASTLNVTFSEGVYTAAAGGALVAADFAVSGGLTVTGVAHIAGQITATLTLSGNATTGTTTLAAVANGIFDNAANAAGTGAQVIQAPDVTAPSLQSATVNGASLVLTYSETLNNTSVPATSDFAVTVNSLARNVTTVQISGQTVTLTLASAVTSGQTVVVSYTAGANPIRDPAGNNAANLVNQAVTNNTPAPLLQTATINGAALVLTYNQTLNAGSVPAVSNFAVTVSGIARSVTLVQVSGQTVTLTLASAVTSTQTVVVSYTAGANPIRDLAGNNAANLINQAVANNTPATPPPPEPPPSTTPPEEPEEPAPSMAADVPGVALEAAVVDTTFNMVIRQAVDTTAGTTNVSNSGVQMASPDEEITIDIPFSAVPQGVTRFHISAEPVADFAALTAGAPALPRTTLQPFAYEITAADQLDRPVMIFQQPLTITFQASPAEIDLERALVFFYDPVPGEWAPIDATLGPDGAITFSTNHLTLFALFEVDPRFVSLHAGWNLVTFAGLSGSSSRDLAARIGPRLRALWRFDGPTQSWQGYQPAAPAALNNLLTLNRRDTLFVQISAGPEVNWLTADLFPTPSGQRRLTMAPGWNAIAFTGSNGTQARQVFGSIPTLRSVYRFDAAAQEWRAFFPAGPAQLNDFTALQRLDGLFLYFRSDKPVELPLPES